MDCSGATSVKTSGSRFGFSLGPLQSDAIKDAVGSAHQIPMQMTGVGKIRRQSYKKKCRNDPSDDRSIPAKIHP
jgi:hypothetical protein